MRLVYTVFALVVVCSAAVLTKAQLLLDHGAGSEEHVPILVAAWPVDSHEAPDPAVQDGSARADDLADSTTTQTSTKPTATTSALPSINGTTTTALPSINATTTTALPSINATTTTSLPSINAITTTALPSINATTTTVVPSVNATTTTTLPSVNATTTTALPSTSATTTMALPSINATTTTAPPSINATTTTALPSINATTTTVLPSTNATTTTILPSINATTTTALPSTNATTTTPGNATATCTPNAVCFHNEDCGSTGAKKGMCLGVFNGKCNCNACLSYLPCKDDSACGGLKGACNTATSSCDCDAGYKANGFAGGFVDALRELCNVKDCTGGNHADACFGLPCNSGVCIC